MSEAVVKKIQKTQRLLSQFGLKGYAFDPGVACYYIEKRRCEGGISDSGGRMDFGSTEWAWLEPLLKELIRLRKEEKKRDKKERSR